MVVINSYVELLEGISYGIQVSMSHQVKPLQHPQSLICEFLAEDVWETPNSPRHCGSLYPTSSLPPVTTSRVHTRPHRIPLDPHRTPTFRSLDEKPTPLSWLHDAEWIYAVTVIVTRCNSLLGWPREISCTKPGNANLVST